MFPAVVALRSLPRIRTKVHVTRPSMLVDSCVTWGSGAMLSVSANKGSCTLLNLFVLGSIYHEYPAKSKVQVIKNAKLNQDPSVEDEEKDVVATHPCSCMAIAPCKLIIAVRPVLILVDLVSSASSMSFVGLLSWLLRSSIVFSISVAWSLSASLAAPMKFMKSASKAPVPACSILSGTGSRQHAEEVEVEKCVCVGATLLNLLLPLALFLFDSRLCSEARSCQLEPYSRASGESNHHQQSVSAVKNDALPTEPRGLLLYFH